jgi:hypothetical protein
VPPRAEHDRARGPVLHREVGVRPEVHEHLVELPRVREDAGSRSPRLHLHLDRRGKGAPKKGRDLFDHRIDVDRSAFGVGPTTERENPSHEVARPGRGPDDLFQVRAIGAVGGEVVLHLARLHQNRHEKVVEVVRDSAGQGSQCLHLLRLHELPFERTALRDLPLELLVRPREPGPRHPCLPERPLQRAHQVGDRQRKDRREKEHRTSRRHPRFQFVAPPDLGTGRSQDIQVRQPPACNTGRERDPECHKRPADAEENRGKDRKRQEPDRSAADRAHFDKQHHGKDVRQPHEAAGPQPVGQGTTDRQSHRSDQDHGVGHDHQREPRSMRGHHPWHVGDQREARRGPEGHVEHPATPVAQVVGRGLGIHGSGGVGWSGKARGLSRGTQQDSGSAAGRQRVRPESPGCGSRPRRPMPWGTTPDIWTRTGHHSTFRADVIPPPGTGVTRPGTRPNTYGTRYAAA